MIYIRECFAYVIFWDFYDVLSYIEVSKPL